MAIQGFGVNGWLMSLREEASILGDALREKGAKHFSRPLGMAALMVFIAYFYVYRPPKLRLMNIDAETKAAEAVARHSGTYKELKDKLAIFYSRVPKTEDPPEKWLLDTIRETLVKEGIVPNSFSPPTQTVVEGYRFVSIAVNCEVSYAQIASWISRIERSSVVLYVKAMNLKKSDATPGMNIADVTVTTVFPDKPGGAP